MGALSKVIIVVDEDINPKDSDAVMWALSFSMQPQRDVQIVTGRVPGLDPSALSLMQSKEDRNFPGQSGTSGLLIDATRKGPYPPVGLPSRELMEGALEVWRDEGLPEPKLREPWYGYVLPNHLWTERDDQRARLALDGGLLDKPTD
jgi:4-hydroxy-3-polyprenylbenzoate decarboxylase